MILSFDIIKDCFTVNLLIYSWRFIKLYDFTIFLEYNGVKSVTSRWFLKISYLMRNHVYDYEKSRKTNSSNIYNSLVRLKLVELSLSFLLISFFKSFLVFDSHKWVRTL